ncbi:polymeric immunoglobulin receptor-like isoform X4 [Polypterus senegalus]|uniref:polymeric immunoglobulin receptor-like isoform X4 n=1 Tax=Polypterus senegalus TaxID=55291 RepID=UPI0019641EDA|nr:polymeric immunoglobulin receptor-like isoform X4 [Polypterus senegalus]
MDLLNAALLGLLFMVGAAGVAGLTGPLIVIGTEGESVSVKCYSNQHIFSNSAFWCRFGLYGKCHQIIRADDNKMDTKVNIEMVHSGFEIKINKITASDAGQYQCGLSDYYDETHKVELKVLPAPGLKGPMRVTALVDRSVEVKCQYSQKYNSPFYKKYFCKWTSNDLCNKLTSYTRPKVTIKDNDSSSLFDATLSDLVKNDAGRYACGISDQYNMEITSPVELVLHTDIKGNPKVTGAVGMSVVMTSKEEDTTITHQTDGSSRTANSGTRIIAWLNENKIFLIIIGVLLVLILIIVVLLIARMIRRRVRLTHNDKDNSFGVRLRNVQNTPAVYPEVQSSQQMASIGTSVDIEESSSDSSECSEDTPVVRVKERCNDDYVNVDKELRKEDDDYVNMVSPDGERPESKGSPKLTCDYVNVEPLDSSESEEEEEEKKEEVDKEPESSDLNPSRRLYKLQKSQQSDSSDSEGDTVEYTQIVFH